MFRKSEITRIIPAISTLFLLIFLFISLSAQEKSASEKVLIGGKMYTLYMALPGDSPFSIARKFGITLEELNNANPEIKDKLNSGQTVKIPVSPSETQQKPVTGLQKDESDDLHFTYHSVRRKETVFSIAQKNNITSEDIYSHNPQSRDKIKVGDVLKIPKSQASVSDLKAIVSEIQQPKKHTVKRKETLSSIAQQYSITQEDLLKSNPEIKGSISKGTVLIIPSNSTLPQGQEDTKDVLKYIDYQIVTGDNFYQFEKRYGISRDELEKLNPILKDGLKTGMIIKIPSIESKKVTSKINTEFQIVNKQKNTNDRSISNPGLSFTNQNKTFQIGVFLPFCQNLSDSSRIAQRTASFLAFYSGVLLATEKLSDAGLKLKIFTYDTYQDNKVVEKLVKRPEFLSLDLIIGPVYPENQKTVAELSAKNNIAMISPLSSDSRFVSTTQGYYQINPGKKLRIANTAEYIASEFAGQNIILLNHGSNSGNLKLIIDRLNQKLGAGKFRQYNILANGTSGLEEMLQTDKENIIVLAEGSEANVSVSMTRLNTISKLNKIKVIGLQEYTKMQSINIEYLHNTRLHYLAPYFIEYGNPGVNTFIEKYRTAYGSEPTQYSFQGYDIALYFFASLGLSGKNFSDANTKPGVDLLQADYNFQKPSDFGGYINQTFYIIEYTDTYEVHSTGKILGAIQPNLSEGVENNDPDQ